MRFSPPAIALACTLALVSSVSFAQTRYQPTAGSNALLQKGVEAQDAGDFDAAYDFYESALVNDPRNAMAYIAMAQIADAQELPGKAIQLYGKALELEPNNALALSGQGRSYVRKGAISRAEANLATLRLSCTSPCAPADQLEQSIAAGPPQPVVTAEAIAPVLTVEDAPAE